MSENLLRFETSPYLLQHKDNPVHWRPWGARTFEEARRLDKPILLSVGYSACHWCHVMAHESFENPDIATLMNALFVNVKVDREERPDVDQLYMAGLHALGGRGGWPLTVFLTPKGELYWGGTYFPPTARFGHAGFPDVLRQVEKAYRDAPDRVAANAARVMATIADAGAGAIAPALLDEVSRAIAGEFDAENGGLRGAPKFPQASLFEFILRSGERLRERSFIDAFLLGMTRICQGGIQDHLGGGFARYSVDEAWRVPHFEKMLYDNAQLIRLLGFAWRIERRPLFARAVERTVEWLEREMRLPGGAFAASLDADSSGQEGAFYVWTTQELEAALGPEDGRFAAHAYGVTSEGNWEEAGGAVNVLNRLDATLTPEQEERLDGLRARLFEVRCNRPPPARDDKALADWNGLAIEALADAARVFERPDWLDFARRAYRFVLDEMTQEGRVGHSARAGAVTRPGLASDAANVTAAALSLFEATGERRYLDEAIAFHEALERFHFDPEGGFLLSASDADDILARPSGARDDATPNPNAVAGRNLVRLGALTGEASYAARAARLFDLFGGAVEKQPFAHLGLLNAFDFAARLVETTLIGAAANDPLARAVDQAPDTNLVVLRLGASERTPQGSPAEGRSMIQGRPTAYVCRERVCSLPITERDALVRELSGGFVK